MEDSLEQKKKDLKARLEKLGFKNKADGASSSNFNHGNNSQFPDMVIYVGSLYDCLNPIGGKIHITPTRIIFKPNSLNFGNPQERSFEIGQIAGYEKGILSFLNIYFRNGEKVRFATWKKTEIINELEKRRLKLV